MYLLIIILFVLILFIYSVLRLPVFGGIPGGTRLARIQSLPNYNSKVGALENLSFTPVMPEGVTYLKVLKTMIQGNKRSRPDVALPHVKADFTANGKNRVIWFGHSSYLLQLDGYNILVDPVFSNRVSPFSFLGSKRFPGTDFIRPEDFPELDIVLITHDHYDHLDYRSILQLKYKTKHFITSQGVAAHLERWGISSDHFTELVWGEEKEVSSMKFRATAARHFTGRTFKRNQTLWSAFILQTNKHKLYLGGDSGYDTHFKQDGEKYGPFDLAILECGQYHDYWPHIHMFPEQTVQAASDLKASVLLPVHWSKFALALHDWNEPVQRVVAAADNAGLQVTTPLPGEAVVLDEYYPRNAWYMGTSV